jgi:6-phosphofructokinase 1
VDDKQARCPTAKDFEPPAFVVEGPGGSKETVRPLVERDVLPAGGSIRRLKVENLGDTFPTRQVQSPLRELTSHYVDQDAWVTEVILRQNQAKTFFSSLTAGPREKLHFQPSEVVATIVTCGGLCPGLNSVVRQVVQMLNMYGVKKVYGIPSGYKGVTEPHNWVELTPKVVQDIHDLGGTVLASDRGNPPVEEQAEALRHMGVRAHFVIGGDGTHRGAHATYEAMKKVGWECAVVGVPKTIDNDVPMLDRTFGFDTACTEAAKAVHAAYTEATCNANCIGLVKLMGRHSGFIAMHACLAARFVDMCLLPEMDIELDKVLDHCLHLLQTKGHA